MRRFLAFTPTLYLKFEPITKAGPRHALCGVAYLLVMAPMAFSQDVTEHSVLYYDPPSVPNPVSTLGPHLKIGLGGTQPHWQTGLLMLPLSLRSVRKLFFSWTLTHTSAPAFTIGVGASIEIVNGCSTAFCAPSGIKPNSSSRRQAPFTSPPGTPSEHGRDFGPPQQVGEKSPL
jgi:hypothetical protein